MDERDEWATLRQAVDCRIQQPPFAVLAERAANRGRRRTTRMAGIAVTVAVLIAVPLVSLLVGRVPAGERQQAPAPGAASGSAAGSAAVPTGPVTHSTPARPQATPESTPPEQAWPRSLTSILATDFFDQIHGYAVLQRCPNRTLPCTTVLAVTTDGQTWSERSTPVPPTLTDNDPSASLEVLGSAQVVVHVPGTTSTDPGRAWFSADAGRTWADVGMKVTQHITALPDGAVLEPECAIPSSQCWTAGTIRLPDTGALAELDSRPNFLVQSLIQGEQPGMWLMIGRSGSIEHPEPMIARSTDRGRSWTTAALPTLGSQFFALAISHGGSTWYAAAIGQYPDVKNGLLAIYRSTDNARTWTLTWRGKNKVEPRSLLGVLIAGDSQLVAMTESGSCFVSRTDGRTFSPTRCPPVGWTAWTRSGYLSSSSESGGISRSQDGVHWTSSKP